MKKFYFALLSITAASFFACGPKPIAYLKIGYAGEEEMLVEDVDIYYDHEKTPKGAQIIEHLKQQAQDIDCKRAALIALVQMQKKALQKGGNALVHLKAVPEGEEPVSSAEGFWCERSKALEEGADLTHKIWQITWEGDIARVVDTLEENEEVEAPQEDEEGADEDSPNIFLNEE